MNRARLYLHRLFRRPAVTNSMPIYTRRLPDGMALDLEDYFQYVVTTLCDDEDARNLFNEVAEDRALAREHDGWEPERLYLEQLATYVGYEIPVRGKSLSRLAKRLTKAAEPAPVAVSGQREAGAS